MLYERELNRVVSRLVHLQYKGKIIVTFKLSWNLLKETFFPKLQQCGIAFH